MEPSLMERLFGLLGKICFPRQQDWAQRRNAKIMVATVVAAIGLGLALVFVIKHMNSSR